MMLPCSVPTRNLDGPATASYSVETAPKIRSEFFSFTWSVSTGSPSRRMSHQKTFPSVEHVMHSVPVLLCIQAMSYTGSLRLCSIGDVSTGTSPFLTSQ